ncbi:hypothetical protein EKD16_03535 [Streptomonospora litoralis]|uniref:Uncharacterized protein n=1 Tax=Streptomonospora litoralis TaxID=2498135 RepID=A0A4P6PWG8_9ACTN|nr:hypothetical protein EKD16_03535 [Streptomonospora litoralis]
MTAATAAPPATSPHTRTSAGPATGPTTCPDRPTRRPAAIHPAARRLSRLFPGVCAWYGTYTGRWWAVLPGHLNLVEAGTADALERHIAALLSGGPTAPARSAHAAPGARTGTDRLAPTAVPLHGQTDDRYRSPAVRDTKDGTPRHRAHRRRVRPGDLTAISVPSLRGRRFAF